MAPLPYNSTSVYTLTYATSFNTHDVGVRYNSFSPSLQAVADFVGGFFIELAPILDAGFTYVSARNLNAGDNFTLPAPLPSIGATPGAGAITENEAVISHSFIGRTQGGRRAIVPVYGLNLPTTDDFKYELSDNATLDAAVAYLRTGFTANGAIFQAFVGIDGQEVTWYNRITVNYNDYWVRQARK